MLLLRGTLFQLENEIRFLTPFRFCSLVWSDSDWLRLSYSCRAYDLLLSNCCHKLPSVHTHTFSSASFLESR